MHTDMVEAGSCECKVGQAATRYELTDLDIDVAERHQDGASLRNLADFVNREILRSAIHRADGDLLRDSEHVFGALDEDNLVGAIYEALSGDDVPYNRDARVRTKLEQASVDIESVESSWVTHMTVRSHLRDCLDIDTSSSADITADQGVDTIQWAVARCRGVVEETLNRIRSAEGLHISEPEVDITVRIACIECGATYSPTELLEEGHCDCIDDQ